MPKRYIYSLILKCIVFVSAIVGVIVSAVSSSDTFMGGKVVFMYFTIQSNLALAVICLVGGILILLKKDMGRLGGIMKLVGTVSITLTGVVFCFVLAPTLGVRAWNLQNLLTHVIVPIGSILDYFVISKEYTYKRYDCLWVLVPPLLYTIYAAIGYIAHFEFAKDTYYPYFFLNWGSKAGAFGFTNELPFMGTMWWILVLLLFLLGIAYLYCFLLDIIYKRKK